MVHRPSQIYADADREATDFGVAVGAQDHFGTDGFRCSIGLVSLKSRRLIMKMSRALGRPLTSDPSARPLASSAAGNAERVQDPASCIRLRLRPEGLALFAIRSN
jgi:hypothetical protein